MPGLIKWLVVIGVTVGLGGGLSCKRECEPRWVDPDGARCEPTECNAAGTSTLEISLAMDKYQKENGLCAQQPAELMCRFRSALAGMDWRTYVEKEIGGADADTEGSLTEHQAGILRCLAALEPAGEFDVASIGGREDVELYVGLALELHAGVAGNGQAVFEDVKALAVALAEVDSCYETRAEGGFEEGAGPASGKLVVTRYKGIPFERDWTVVEVVVSPGVVLCEGEYTVERIYAEKITKIASAAETPVVTEDRSVDIAIEKCNNGCAVPAEGFAGPELIWGSDMTLIWRLQGLDCVHFYCGLPSSCTCRVDAITGDFLGCDDTSDISCD
jgi:hypothetical protein